MWQKQVPAIFYTGLIAGGCLCFWNDLTDASFLPRVLFVAAWLLLFSPFVVKVLFTPPFKFDWADAGFGAYIALHVVSIAQAINPAEAIYETLRMVLIGLSYMVLKRGLQQKLLTHAMLLRALLLVCAIYTGYGLLQLLVLLQQGKAFGDNLYVVTGAAGHKNLYSGFLLLTTFLLAALGIQQKGYWRITALATALLQIFMIVVLQSRSVYLGMAAAMLVIAAGAAYMERGRLMVVLRKVALPFLAVAVVVGLYFAFSGTFTYFINRLDVSKYSESATGVERRAIWYRCVQLLKDEWLMGVGAHNWALVYPKYSLNGLFRSQYLNTVFIQPHNDLLWIWCELGIFGLLAFLSVFLALAYQAIKFIGAETKPVSKYAMLLLLALQAGFLVFCFFDFPKDRMEQQLMLILSWALVSTMAAPYARQFTIPGVPTRVAQLLYIAVVALGLYAAGVRIRSEYYMRPLLAAQARNDAQSAMLLARQMNHPLCNVTGLFVPVKWYEGVAAYALQQPAQAYECFKEAHQRAPYNVSVLNNLGAMELYYNRYDSAFSYFKQALSVNNRNDDTRFNVALALYNLKRYNEAIDTVSLVWSNQPRKAEFIRVISAARDSAALH